FEARRRAKRRRPRRAELGVHPRHYPWRRVVTGVGDIHAARRPEHDRARTGGFGDVAHNQRAFAALARAVTRDEVFRVRDLLDRLDRAEVDQLGGWSSSKSHINYSRTPIQWTLVVRSPAAPRCNKLNISSPSFTVTSR